MPKSRVIKPINTGLLIKKDTAGFIDSVKRKSDKKVQKKTPNTMKRNLQMLDLLRAAPNQTIAGDDGYPVIYIESLFTPPKWRDTNTNVKAIYYQRALEQIGTVFALTLNISPKLTENILDKNGLKIIRKRIAQALIRYLGYSVDFWFTLETSIKGTDKNYQNIIGRPHLHGAIRIEESEKKTVQSALRSINGITTTKFKQHESRLKPIDKTSRGGDGWVNYVLKHRNIARIFIPNSNILTCTQRTTNIAKILYEKDRQAIKKQSEKIRKGVTNAR